MKIQHLKINHLINPLGFELSNPTLSYVVSDTEGTRQEKARILVAGDPAFTELVHDSGENTEIRNTGYLLPSVLLPETKYYWKVQVWADNGDFAESETAWFETAKSDGFSAEWITPALPKEVQAVLMKTFRITKPVAKARFYGVGLGLYELYLNREKQGDECLLPGFCDYDAWIPYQTFDVSLQEGENLLEIALADGWYKGWYGLIKKEENYGDRLAAIGELKIWYEDGSVETIPTDTTWKARKNQVCYSGIYPGEIYDTTLDVSELFDTETIDLGKERLCPRLNPPITIHEHIRPIEVIHTPAGETVLDMGQNMVGWLSFKSSLPAGSRLYLQFGEVLQNGNFYNDNLRTAKAEFTYISDGQEREVRQHFTFYGFRFVKITGWSGEPSLDDFTGLVIHSEMEELGHIETSDPLINQLFHNAWWGMKGNFLDVPTDCPQRDERYGWTGDAQIFSGTACFNMDTYAFYTKFGKDLYEEQKKLNGSVPDVVPVANNPGDASTAWGDAATIIPWNVYLHSGDPGILIRQYDSMKAWVDYMRSEDQKYGNNYLWQSGFHYGDWLALDGNYPGGVYGATEPFLICSGYYYYSANIVAKTARILGKAEDAAYYEDLVAKIKDAFAKEYFTPSGRLAVNTMTAHVVALFMDLTPDYALEKTRQGLFEQLRKNRYHLNTGFVGTPYLCRVLSDNGMNDMAYQLLMEKGYPSWLYQITMGATTVWERWNSLLPDGSISGTGMNSLNHYSYGSIVEWMYRDMLGIVPLEEKPGFKSFCIAPKPNYRIQWAKGNVRTMAGTIESSWEIRGKELSIHITVPFDAKAYICLPDAPLSEIEKQTSGYDRITDLRQSGKNVCFTAAAGQYSFCYEPVVPYRHTFSVDSPVQELMDDPGAKKVLDEEYFSYVHHFPFFDELYTLRELMNGPFTNVPYEQQEKIDRLLRAVIRNDN